MRSPSADSPSGSDCATVAPGSSDASWNAFSVGAWRRMKSDDTVLTDRVAVSASIRPPPGWAPTGPFAVWCTSGATTVIASCAAAGPATPRTSAPAHRCRIACLPSLE